MRTARSIRIADGRITSACTTRVRFPDRRRRRRRPARRDRSGGRPAASWSSPRPNPPRATPATRRAASPRRWATTTRPALHAADTIRAGDGLCDEAAVRVLVEDGPRVRPRAASSGARASTATPTAVRRSAARRRTACAACCTPATRPAARSAACCGSACARCPSVETIDHALVTELIVERRRVRAASLLRRGGA